MNQLYSLLNKSFFDKNLDLRIRLFNILAMAGMTVSFISAVAAVVMEESPENTVVYLVFALLSAILLMYASKSGKYQRCYLITILIIFLSGFRFSSF